MAHSLTSLVTMSNLGVSGDIGDITFYNDRRGNIIFYPASPPLTPPSAAQRVMRQRWATYMRQWSELTAAQQADWRLAVQRAGLQIGATALWLWYQITRDRATLATIERQSGVSLVT